MNDGDLFAPALLNAAPTVRAFYSLQRVRPGLIKALAEIPVDLTLADAVAAETMPALLGDLVAVLDGPERPGGVRLTTLLKVLHRKRPEFIPLYDQLVGACYYGGADPFPVRPTPGWLVSGYAVAVATAINDDLRSQQSVFDELHELAPQVSRLRSRDVLAWKVGRRSPADDRADMPNWCCRRQDLGLPRLRAVFSTGAAAAHAGSEIAANSGRWVKLTKESAHLVKKHGLRENSKGLSTGVVKGSKGGQIGGFVDFVKVPGSLLTTDPDDGGRSHPMGHSRLARRARCSARTSAIHCKRRSALSRRAFRFAMVTSASRACAVDCGGPTP